MALLHSRASLWVLSVPGRVGAATAAVVLGVTAWWLLIVASIAGTVPAPPVLAQIPEFVSPGRSVEISAPPRVTWSTPVSRAEFDAYNLAFDMDDEAALESSFAATEWIPVADQQVVRIIQVDDMVVQVEVLDGAFAGRRGWLKARQLRPWLGPR
jgi:hypothetical protein